MNKLLKSTLISGFVALACASAGPAAASTFQGTVWSLSTNHIDLNPDPLKQTFAINFTVDTTGYTGTGYFLQDVALKVSSSLIDNSLIGNPLFYNHLVSAPGGVSHWSLHSGGISASGCNGSGGGFECAASTTVPGGVGVGSHGGGIYTWVFDLTMANGKLFTGHEDDSTVKGLFVDSIGHKVGAILSEDDRHLVTTVPEPETYAMFLAGLGLMGFMARRRSKTS